MQLKAVASGEPLDRQRRPGGLVKRRGHDRPRLPTRRHRVPEPAVRAAGHAHKDRSLHACISVPDSHRHHTRGPGGLASSGCQIDGEASNLAHHSDEHTFALEIARMTSGNPDIWRRVRCAAILTGHGGPRELADAMGEPGLSHITLRRVVYSGEPGRMAIPEIAERIEQYAASQGVAIPASWILGGFGDEPLAAPEPPPTVSVLADRARAAVDALEREARRVERARG